jgi:hypothetical protein
LDAFQKAAQYFAIGDLHVQGQGDYVVDDDMGGQVTLAITHFAGPFQDVLNQGSRKGLGYHS